MSQTILEKQNKLRLVIFLGLIFLWVGLIFARLFYLQVMQSDYYRKEATARQETILNLAPRRGIIFDRNGEKLAISVEAESLIVNPQAIQNPTDTLERFSHILGLDRYELCKSFNDKKEKNRKFLFIKRKLDPKDKRKILNLDIEGLNFCKGKDRRHCEIKGDIEKHFNEAGIYFQKEYKRYYPKGYLASHVVGISDIDEKGLEGIELLYDDLLRENPSSIQVFKDASGNMFPLEHSGYRKKENHLVLTIDSFIQHITERELDKAFRTFKAFKGCAIVMDPETGEILALAVRPTFNPNCFNAYPEKNRKNISITEIYEPGSTFKVISLASLIEQGKFHSSEIINCGKGSIYIYGIRISDHHAYDYLTALQVIEKSSNVGMIQLSEKLSEESLYQTIESFRFKEKTGIDLPGEAVSPYVRDPSSWSKISKAVVSIGQEIAVTPIQMLVAYAAIANGGVMVQPHVAKGYLDPIGDFIPFEEFPKRRVISASTAKKITSILEKVVLSGTGQKATIPGYSIAGKTGTAQKFDNTIKAYSSNNFVASFIGYAPSYHPKIICLVILDIPKGKKFYGGDVAAPVFSKIVEQTLLYLQIPPNHRIFPTEKLNEPYYQKYSNKAASPSPPPNKAYLIKNQNILMAQSIPLINHSKDWRNRKTPWKEDQMPDLTGMSLRDAMALLLQKGIRVQVSGSGYVIHQYPDAGMTLCNNDVCVLGLSNDSYQLENALQREEKAN